MRKTSKASDQENDWTKFLGGNPESKDARIGLPEKLITSDKDMEAKTRLPDILAVTAMDLYKKWAQGELTSLEDLLDYVHESGGFGDRFRINAPNLDGKARWEFMVTAIGTLLAERVEELLPPRMREGNRK